MHLNITTKSLYYSWQTYRSLHISELYSLRVFMRIVLLSNFVWHGHNLCILNNWAGNSQTFSDELPIWLLFSIHICQFENLNAEYWIQERSCWIEYVILCLIFIFIFLHVAITRHIKWISKITNTSWVMQLFGFFVLHPMRFLAGEFHLSESFGVIDIIYLLADFN